MQFAELAIWFQLGQFGYLLGRNATISVLPYFELAISTPGALPSMQPVRALGDDHTDNKRFLLIQWYSITSSLFCRYHPSAVNQQPSHPTDSLAILSYRCCCEFVSRAFFELDSFDFSTIPGGRRRCERLLAAS